jgi:hypothetical protein
MNKAPLYPLLVLVAACGAATTPAPTTPAPAESAAKPAETRAVEPAPAAKTGLPPAPEGVPPPPRTCNSYGQRQSASPVKCADAAAGLAALDKALAETGPEVRDSLLIALEKCETLPAGLVRALRAELGPTECGDVIVEPFLAEPGGVVRIDIKQTLVGLGLAARLSRLVRDAPRLSPPYDRDRVLEFTRGPVTAFVREQAAAIQKISEEAVKLSGYAKGISAVEAGLADMRFVKVIRGVPVPTEIANDPALSEAYYATLDQLLEPRKDRGRDAALVGLQELAGAGVLREARVDRARALLSKLYGGRRIDLLDALLLPPLPPPGSKSVEERIATHVPTFYSGLLLDEKAATQPALLRALIERGLPPPMRPALDAEGVAPEALMLYARAELELGQRYWRAADFEKAAALTDAATPKGAKKSDEAALVAAVANALKSGPRDAAEMMLKGPMLASTAGRIAPLDELVKAKSPLAGMAAFDAGHILGLGPPAKPDAAFWKNVAKHFRDAEARLTEDAQKKSAAERASAAEATAASIK